MIIRKLNIPSLVPLPGTNPLCRSLISFRIVDCILLVRISSKILDAWLMRLMVLKSVHFVLLVFFGIITNSDTTKSSGHLPVVYMALHSLVSSLISDSPKLINISVGIPSTPQALPVLSFLRAASTSSTKIAGPCTRNYKPQNNVISLQLSQVLLIKKIII